ncbi:MAG: AAA domain-containing protein [Collinsella sp.]|nr:AAA domain-containing protein [Collinsella sp.]
MERDGSEAVEKIVAYYRAAAAILGRDREHGMGKGHRRQAGYSLLWFFKHCLDAGMLGDIPRAFLGDEAAMGSLLFFDPPEIPVDDPRLLERWRPDGTEAPPLTPAQRRAIARALSNPISFIQGPAGTGKTETILNMVSVMLSQDATVAVVSNNAAALDNIATKVRSLASAGADHPRRARLASSFAELGALTRREAWNLDHPEGPFFTLDSQLLFRKEHGTGGWEPRLHARKFLDGHPFVTSTIHSLIKCFADGDRFRYDYLIMDEASQCGVMAGVLALSCAKHVVLVGDTEQLAPIPCPEADGWIARRCAKADIPTPCHPLALNEEEGDGMSILKAAEIIFEAGTYAPKTFLDQHFRCHPGIIRFCCDTIYEGDGLKVRTPEYDRSVHTPIRVRWFEGNYCEAWYPPAGDERSPAEPERTSKVNMKQLRVFMDEEWPRLRTLMAADPDLSACILSPFQGQLAELHALMAQEGAGGLRLEDGGPAGSDGAALPSQLTVHKAQGQEFDIVYLLPVEDGDWEWPWSQGRRLVNVAVSRAKRELVVVTSSTLMSERVQRGLGAAPVIPSISRALSPEQRAAREERGRYIKRLIDYVWDRCAGEEGAPGGQAAFGFHRTGLVSVFDAKTSKAQGMNDEDQAPSAPESLLADALDAADLPSMGLDWAAHLPLRSIFNRSQAAALEEPQRAFINRSWSHFDFVIFDRRDRSLVLAIEVDGGRHRTVSADKRDQDTRDGLEKRREHDRLKDSIVRAMGGVVLMGNAAAALDLYSGGTGAPSFTLLRLPDDGTCALEVESIARAVPSPSFATIERIAMAQRRAQEGQRSIRNPLRVARRGDPPTKPKDIRSSGGRAPGISALLSKLAGHDPLFSRIAPADANRALEEAGFIRKTSAGWQTTPVGASIGIRQVMGRFEGEGAQHRKRCYCVYPASCEELVAFELKTRLRHRTP